jgi:hypothetical protein
VQSRSALACALRNLLLLKEQVVNADAFLILPQRSTPAATMVFVSALIRDQIVHSGFTLPYTVLCFRPVEDQDNISVFSAAGFPPPTSRGVRILNANITLVTCPMPFPLRRPYERAGRRCSRMFFLPPHTSCPPCPWSVCPEESEIICTNQANNADALSPFRDLPHPRPWCVHRRLHCCPVAVQHHRQPVLPNPQGGHRSARSLRFVCCHLRR